MIVYDYCTIKNITTLTKVPKLACWCALLEISYFYRIRSLKLNSLLLISAKKYIAMKLPKQYFLDREFLTVHTFHMRS